MNDDDQLMKGDKLVLRGLKFHGFHGVLAEERKLGQKFLVDMDAWLDLRQAGLSDRLSDTISYAEIYSIVKQVVEGSPQTLLESVTHKIASATFTTFPRIAAVRIKLGKPHVAVEGPVDYLGVEIFRTRKDFPATAS
ncbi:dihydroneopterin aldolase 2-like [Silene latifolia]|uniref:dihydroneopterin aldolase 2-like n=1 Tax=Silene latifolia TaxID=37657 RepID=UPI003D77C178